MIGLCGFKIQSASSEFAPKPKTAIQTQLPAAHLHPAPATDLPNHLYVPHQLTTTHAQHVLCSSLSFSHGLRSLNFTNQKHKPTFFPIDPFYRVRWSRSTIKGTYLQDPVKFLPVTEPPPPTSSQCFPPLFLN